MDAEILRGQPRIIADLHRAAYRSCASGILTFRDAENVPRQKPEKHAWSRQDDWMGLLAWNKYSNICSEYATGNLRGGKSGFGKPKYIPVVAFVKFYSDLARNTGGVHRRDSDSRKHASSLFTSRTPRSFHPTLARPSGLVTHLGTRMPTSNSEDSLLNPL
ncbi:hypothetical protein A0H81_14144 [Grifola frondosa]|uniref:Uncharacterized protein n=1 Tax=Grifola frondosa TaxID=5627 RepID=A0A1C7LN35_GRIFR|nr:hypothetical protein A0H81_14144 [Grifola frondosa]